MIRCVAYGASQKGRFFVQTCCGEEHDGSQCDCRSFGEYFLEEEAAIIAEKKAKTLNVGVENWGK